MMWLQFCMGGAIPAAHRGRFPADQPAIVIAPDRRKIARHQDVGRAGGIQRAAEVIAEIDHIVDGLCSDIGKHGFESKVIAVDIGDHCDFHTPVLWLSAVLRAFPST